MKKIGRLSFVFMSVLLSVLLVAGCQNENEDSNSSVASQSTMAPAKDQGAPAVQNQPLEILQMLPTVGTAPLTQVVVMFNQPMVALGDYKNVPEGALSVTPPTPGEMRWLNQYTLAYIFSEPLMGSHDLTVALAPGLKALSGAELKEGRTVKLSLPLLEAYNVSPLNYQDLSLDEVLSKPWIVRFNQKVKPENFAGKAFFVIAGQKIEAKVEERSQDSYYTDGGQKEAYLFTPKSPLPQKGGNYYIELDEGIKTEAGPVLSKAIKIELNDYAIIPTALQVKLPNLTQKVDPSSGISITFTNPVDEAMALKDINLDQGYDIKSIRDYYAQQATAEQDGVLTEESHAASEALDPDKFTTSIYLPGPLKPNTTYTITISNNIKDAYGFQLKEPVEYSFQTRDFDPDRSFDSGFGIFEKGTEPKLPVMATNVESVDIYSIALTGAEAVKYLQDFYVNPGSSYVDNSQFKAYAANHKFQKNSITVPNGAKDGPIRLAVDLANIFGQDRFNKLMLVNIPHKYTDSNNIYNQIFVAQVTDIALSSKIGAASSLVWVKNAATGQSWPGVNLELFDGTGSCIWRGQSAEDGLAKLPGLNELKANYEEMNNYVLIAQADDQSLIWKPSWDDQFENWRWDISYSSPAENNKNSYWLLSSLPIYKPGETVELKIIGRKTQGDELLDLTDKTVKFTINDSQGRTFLEEEQQPSKFGKFYLKFTLPQDASLGDWYLSAEELESGNSYGDHVGSFLVQTYRAPALEVNLDNLPAKAFVGQKIDIESAAKYHFGAPVSGQPISYNVAASRSFFSLPGLSEFNVINQFSADNEYEDSGYGYMEPAQEVTSGTAQLDKSGLYSFPLELSLSDEQKPSPRSYEINVTVEDVDRRTVSTSANLLVHPANIYIGLDSDSFIGQANEPFKIKMVAADIEGKIVSGQKIKTTLYRQSWQTVRRKGAGSVYEYVSKMVNEKISENEVESQAAPSGLEVVPPKAGYYWLVAETKDNEGRLNQSSLDFYVGGPDAVGWRMSNDDKLTMIADKAEYKPGDTAKIMVQSPFEKATALVTVERAGVRSAQLYEVNEQAPVFEVPLAEEDAPNVFVSVILTRGRIAEKPDKAGVDLGKPAVRMGYAELKVQAQPDLYTVKVTTDQKEVRPGSEVTIDLSVTDYQNKPVREAEVALVIADASVLQLVSDSTYFPDRFFQAPRSLEVSTSDSLVSIIGRRNWGLKGANPGGGGGLMAAGLNSALDIRRLFKSLAHFEPSLALDENGKASLTVKMPDNLTTFKIYAVATGHGRKGGTGQGQVLVSKNLLVRSSLPNYAGVGDEFQASIIVSNRGQEKGQATVKLSGSNYELLDKEAERTIEVKPGDNIEVPFKVKTGSETSAKFLFEVAMGEEKDAVEFNIPVSPPNKLITQAVYDRLLPGDFQTDLSLPTGFNPQRGGLELEIAPSLVGVLSEPFDWLLDYPHGCVEQSTSKAFANLVWLRLKDRVNSNEEKRNLATKQINDHLDKLSQWHQSGAFNYWPEDQNWSGRSAYLSAYVLDFILDAKAADFKMPDSNYQGAAVEFLAKALANNEWPHWYSKEAIRQAKTYILSVLTKAGEKEISAPWIENFYNERQNLNLFELVNLTRAIGYYGKGNGKAVQLKELLSLIMSRAEITAGEVQMMEDVNAPEIWSSNIRTTAMTMETLCQVAPHNDLLPGLVRYLVSLSKNGHFGSTQNNIYALKALAYYVEIMEPENPDISIESLLGETKVAEAKFKSFIDSPVSGSAPLTAISGEKPALSYKVTGTGQAWSSLRLKYALSEPDLTADSSGGFMLSRTFEVIKPEPGGPGQANFKRSEVLRVSVTMMLPAARHNIVLEDRVPAGLEPINFRLKDADQTLLAAENASESDDYYSGYWYNHQEIWPDKVAVYADYLNPGVYVFSYLARAATPGTYLTPGPQAEEMYNPETYGRGSGQTITIEP